MTTELHLSASLENYLEVIGMLVKKAGQARSQDIAESLNVKRSSVTVALRNLAENGLIHYKPYNPISLTGRGKKMAQDIMLRHKTLRKFLHDVLGVKASKADDVACKLEHAIGADITGRLTKFIEFIESCPRAGEEWIRCYEQECSEREKCDKCVDCIDACQENLQAAKADRKENAKMPEVVTLDSLAPGDTCVIEKIGGAPKSRKSLVDMGITKGSPAELLRVAPLGDPISIRIKGYELSLRKEEAACITVKKTSKCRMN